jgi:lipopolysaccharide/colanic/teichoic acid biosynthesis glycosyltransferase
MSVAETISETCWRVDRHQAMHNAWCCRVETNGRWYFQVRSYLERVVAALLLVACSPLLGLLALLIRASSKGAAIYSQRRVGLGGRIFVMYKLRTMACDAESRTGPVWARAGADPRTTAIGCWLRHLHLDELPQLYNIVRGEMSFIGPRPERPEFVVMLADQISGYLDRLAVLPGITGLAQVNLPPDTDISSVRRKLVLDCEYMQCAGLLLDARIVLCTLLRLIGLRGGRAVSLLGLTRSVELPGSETAASPPHTESESHSGSSPQPPRTKPEGKAQAARESAEELVVAK